MLLSLSSGVVTQQLSHQGSNLLDKINAFDQAEVETTNLGQTNMITVSSFCGPHGYIWGYHLAKQSKERHPLFMGNTITQGSHTAQVYSAAPLLQAGTSLLGVVSDPRFPILPGSHIPCANKSIAEVGPIILYGAIGVGIPQNENDHASLMMEDVGTIPANLSKSDHESYLTKILQNLATSIMLVGQNQHVEYKEIFLEIKTAVVGTGQVGCVLVAAPYLTLAQKAIPKGGEKELLSMTLQQWENSLQ